MRIHQTAKRNRSLRFDNLLHHLTEERLLEVYHSLNKRSAKGIDGVKLATVWFEVIRANQKPAPPNTGVFQGSCRIKNHAAKDLISGFSS